MANKNFIYEKKCLSSDEVHYFAMLVNFEMPCWTDEHINSDNEWMEIILSDQFSVWKTIK